MKTTKKRTLAAIAAIFGIIIVLAGCPAEPETPPPDQTQTAATPAAQPPAGTYATAQTVALTTDTEGAAIHYTLDGTVPTASSPVYNSPFLISNSSLLKAVAVKSGMNNSAVLTATYTITTVTPPEPTPPTASITNNNQTVTLAPDLEIDLNGTATKGTNEIKSYEWTVKTTESGVTPVFTSGTTLVTKVTGIKKAGTYVFELKVKDTADLEDTAEATVEVNGYQVTTNVSISATTFGVGTTLNFTPTYTSSNTTDFPIESISNYITYTVTSSNGNPNTWNSANGSVTVPMNVSYYDKWTTFTQTFYKNGVVEPVGNRSFYVYVVSGSFDFFGDGSDDIWDEEASFPAITGITLTKTITEILPPPVTKTVTVTFPAFVAGTTLSLVPTYTPTDGWGVFSASDITFTLSSVNPVKDLSDCSNGIITASKYADGDYPTVTITFHYNGQVIGSRKVVPFIETIRFVTLSEYKPTQIDGVWYDSDFVDITTIPPVTLTLTKQGTW